MLMLQQSSRNQLACHIDQYSILSNLKNIFSLIDVFDFCRIFKFIKCPNAILL